jgi:hypothetical protein
MLKKTILFALALAGSVAVASGGALAQSKPTIGIAADQIFRAVDR